MASSFNHFCEPPTHQGPYPTTQIRMVDPEKSP
ncbi:hypothetical protein COLO4_22451 [Corchorus olitorius]|uniref:Uncharacterized protein n=1 Tax=Corchorus olitorius TaxID=93759 RepID=A0A1R3ILS1_9ROSI|nr:hypothetical protein COLO4_22451 [Corchorus olitorius]